MKLQISKSKNATSYYAVESYRIGKKTTTRIVERIGKHNELLERGIEDPLEYAKQRIKELNAEISKEVVVYNQTIDFRTKLENKGIETKDLSVNIGWLYIHKLYTSMGIDKFISTIGGKEEYDLGKIFEYLVVNRFLHPSSKREAYASRENVYGSPEYSLSDGYRALDVIDKNSDKIQKQLFEGTKKVIDLDTSVLYYDCTNFYFECETEDDNIYSNDGDIIQWGLRRYGAGKDDKPNPIVQMGLFTDRNGIPISYCINHGSNNEQNTVIPLERRMRNDYGTSKFIYCADGGLGSYENRFFNAIGNREYVVTQSLKKTAKEELEYIFKDQNWFYVHDDKPVSINAFKKALNKKYKGETLSEEEEQLIRYDMIYKEYPIERNVDPKFLGNGIKVEGKILMKEIIYITFSAKYYLYQKQLFDKQLKIANEWLKRDPDSIKKGPNDIRRFIKTISITKDGELAEKKKNVIDIDVTKKEEKFHGFYAIATSLKNSNVNYILNINASRWKIEQSFRILKSDFDARPVYLSTPAHIKAHFAICYTALLLYRVLESKLNNLSDSPFSSQKILSSIRNMNVIENKMGYFQSIYSGSNILDSLEKQFNLKLNKLYYKPIYLKKLIDSHS